MTDVAIGIDGVSKSFGATRAVHDLSLDVPRGSLCGFLGPNGAGKSTTIRMIMSIIYPDAGRITVLGADALHAKDRIGYLPEERGVYRKMRVSDFLTYMAKLKGYTPANLRAVVSEWLHRVELPDVERKKCEELSKGMQQKVQFVACVIHEPELLILDEPFSGLDPVNADLLNALIRELRDHGTTVIFSTHVLHQAEQICDRIFLIHKGVKLLDSTLGQIRERFDPRTIVAEPVNSHVDFTALSGVRDVRRLDGGDSCELAIDDTFDPQNVMRDVLDAGPMKRVALRQLSLTEVFVRLVKQGEGEQAAERAREELRHA